MPNGEMTGVAARRTIPLLYTLATLTLVTAILFWAKAVLMPLALAMLLAFLLDPVVAVCQRRGLPRVLAVILVIIVVVLALAGLGWVVAGQMGGFTTNLQHYEDNLKRKIGDVRGASKGSFVEQLETSAAKITQELGGTPPAAGDTKPIPVVVQAPSLLWQLPTLLEPLATAGLVIALVIFMLLAQGDMRNRLIRLMGTGQLTLTTRALDEAGQRISRYLLMHTIVNGSHGAVLGLGLFVIGLPYALLWGVLAFLCRFIPYIGPAVSALVPVALSLAAFPGWTQLFLVVGFIIVLELVSNMILEPLIYGRTAGISEVALMVAIAFWTWLWGPIGLLLATPLTVSLGVLGRYVPQLEFLGVLLNDDPALAPSLSYYQRLVARDQDEATDLVEEALRTQSLAETYETMLIPALSAAKKDQARDNLTADQMHFIVQTTREIVEHAGLLSPSSAPPATADAPVVSAPETVLPPPVPIVAYPAHDEADAVALRCSGTCSIPCATPSRSCPRPCSLGRSGRYSSSTRRHSCVWEDWRRAAWPRPATSASGCGRSCRHSRLWSAGGARPTTATTAMTCCALRAQTRLAPRCRRPACSSRRWRP